MSLVRTGAFHGQWHGHMVRFSIEQVQGNGSFDGVGQFTTAPHAGTDFGFTGTVGGDGSLRMTRPIGGGGAQLASAGPPQIVNNQYVWQGQTTGEGIPNPLAFELRIPV